MYIDEGIRLGPLRSRWSAASGLSPGIGGPQVVAILDEGQLELVEFQPGDLAEGRLQRLPREAECATGDEHPQTLLDCDLPMILRRKAMPPAILPELAVGR